MCLVANTTTRRNARFAVLRNNQLKYLNALHAHIERQIISYLLGILLVCIFGHFYCITFNLTNSLPGTVFLIDKSAHPKKGDLAAFVYEGGGPYPKGAYILKIMTGVQGDVVTATDIGHGFHNYFVNGVFVGRSKPYSASWIPLESGPTGTLPIGNYYMAAPNPDSLDSRYSWIGWVKDSQIIGRGIRIL